MAEKVIIDIEIDGTKSIDTMNKLNEEIKTQKKLLNDAKIGSEEYVNANEAINKLTKAHKELTDELTKEERAQKQAAKEMEKAAREAKKAEDQQRKYMEMATMETKSLGDLETKLFGMKKVYRSMPQDTDKAKASAERFAVAIRELDKVVKKGGEGLGEYQRYVGNYERGLMGLDMSFGQTGNSFADFDRDVTQYKESTKTAGFSTDNLEKSVNKMPNALASMAVGITAVIAVITKLTQSVQQSIDTFLRQEDANDMVNDVFGEYSSVINQAANDTQKFSKIGNEQYQELAVQAKNFGIANKDVNQTVQDAIGLADLYGSAGANEELMLEALIDAQNGKTKGLEKYVKELRGVTDEEERARILNEKIAQGWLQASTAGATFGDNIVMIKNAYGDMQEIIGQQILSGVFSPEEGRAIIDNINKITEALDETQFIAKYIGNMREQVEMMLKPFMNLFELFGEGDDIMDSLSVATDFYFKAVDALTLPIQQVWATFDALTSTIVKVVKGFKNIEDLKFQDVLNIINDALYTMVEPLGDVIGLSDEFAKILGVEGKEMTLTAEELKKYTSLMLDHKKIVEDVNKAIKDKQEAEYNEEEEKKKQDAIEAAEKKKQDAIDAANKAYQDHLNKIKQINEEYEFASYFAKNRIEQWDAEKKRITDLITEYQNFLAADGWTEAELEKFAAYKAQLTTDLETVKNQLFEFNTQVNEMLALNPMQILPSKEQLEKQLKETKATINAGMSAWQSARNEEEKARQQDIKDEAAAWEERRQIAESTAVEFGNIIASSIDETGFNLEKFGKMYTQFILDQMQKVVYAAIAEITAREFATKGLAGAVTAGLINASVVAAFQVAKSLVARSGGFAEGGFTGHGGKYEPAGTVHKGEVVFSQADVAALGGAQTVDAMRPTSKQNYYVGGIVGSVPQPVNSSAMLLDAIRQIRPVVTVQDINAVAQAEANRQQIAVV